MAVTTRTLTSDTAYKWGAFALFAATATLLAALLFEHIGGLQPCPLCLTQRWAYYVAIPLLFLSLALVSANQRGLSAAIFLIVAIGFLANAGVGVYHAGVEWKFWPGPDTCSGQALAPLAKAGSQGVLQGLSDVVVIRCDQIAWQFLGLSMAGWNAVISLMIAAASMNAGLASSERHE